MPNLKLSALMKMAFLAKLSKKEKVGLFFAITFIVLAFSDRLVVSPINRKIREINREVKIAERELERDLRNLIQREEITGKYQKYIKYVKMVGSDEEEVAKILAEIEELARKAAINLVDIKPQPPRETDFYKEYAIEIEIEGQIESIVNFLYLLNNSMQLLRADKLRLSSKDKISAVIKSSILITRVLISQN